MCRADVRSWLAHAERFKMPTEAFDTRATRTEQRDPMFCEPLHVLAELQLVRLAVRPLYPVTSRRALTPPRSRRSDPEPPPEPSSEPPARRHLRSCSEQTLTLEPRQRPLGRARNITPERA